MLCVVRFLWYAPTEGSRCVRIRYRPHGIDGIDYRVMSMFDLHVPDSGPAHFDDLGAHNRQVKAISTASRVLHRFADILCRSDDSATKYYATLRRAPHSL
jgi:hypothetical protein